MQASLCGAAVAATVLMLVVGLAPAVAAEEGIHEVIVLNLPERPRYRVLYYNTSDRPAAVQLFAYLTN